MEFHTILKIMCLQIDGENYTLLDCQCVKQFNLNSEALEQLENGFFLGEMVARN